MSVPATRINLLASRDRMALAIAGADLLKSKREALISDFFRIVDTIVHSREEMAREVQRAMTQAGIAKSFAGSQSLTAAALSAKRNIPIKTREINIWGIHIPEIHFVSLRRTPEARGMLPIDTSPHILETAESYEKLLDRLLRTASQEIRLKRLGEEIRKVSRRINALEQSLIPSLSGQIHQMLSTLQEREREDLFRLKHIKKSKRTKEIGR
ncbi:MAG: V-type ATP synthase subunit D [bacterium]|nr:V-type ATP synthase subunit D [bacterium]MDT8396411.1 V-type ATP synthase subunit D [bacterium]